MEPEKEVKKARRVVHRTKTLELDTDWINSKLKVMPWCLHFVQGFFLFVWRWGWGFTAFRKGRGTKDQIANIHWIIKRAREYQKNIYFCFIDYAKAFDCVHHNKLENSSRDGNTRTPEQLPEVFLGNGIPILRMVFPFL